MKLKRFDKNKSILNNFKITQINNKQINSGNEIINYKLSFLNT